MSTSTKRALDKATQAELLQLMLPAGIGNLSVEGFRSYSENFLVYFKALLSEGQDGEHAAATKPISALFSTGDYNLGGEHEVGSLEPLIHQIYRPIPNRSAFFEGGPGMDDGIWRLFLKLPAENKDG